jgi:hypothetical protein
MVIIYSRRAASSRRRPRPKIKKIFLSGAGRRLRVAGRTRGTRVQPFGATCQSIKDVEMPWRHDEKALERLGESGTG